MIAWLAVAAWAGSESWVLAEPTWFIDAPIEISEPLSEWSLTGGYAFRIEEEGVAVGAMLIGDTTWKIDFETPRDALVTANRLAVLERVDPDELTDLFDTGLSLEADRGLLLSHEIWAQLAPNLVVVSDKGVVLDSETEEVLVTGYRSPQSARRLAERALDERMDWLRTHRHDPASLLEVERWQADPQPVFLAEFHTDQAWDRFAGAPTAGANERWLSYRSDPTGVSDKWVSASVFAAHGLDGQKPEIRRVLTARPFAANQRGERRPQHRVDVIGAKATHLFVPEAGSYTATSHSAAKLEIAAKGGSADVLWIDVPHVEQQPWAGEPPLMHSFELKKIAIDGVELSPVHVPMTADQVEGRGSVRTYAVQIPTLNPGESNTVLIEWSDLNRYAHMVQFMAVPAFGWSSEVRDAGSSTNLLRALPTLRTNRAHRMPATIRVGVPADQSRRNHAIVSATDVKEWTEDPWHWIQGETTTALPSIAMGQWRMYEEAGANGAPAVQVALRSGGGETPHEVAVQVRQLVDLYEQVLPDYPLEQIHIAETVAEFSRPEVKLGGGGMIGIGPATTGPLRAGREAAFRRRYPQLELTMLAATLHGHWWVERPYAESSLIGQWAFAMGIHAVETLHGTEVGDTWRTRLRECADAPTGRIGPLTEPGHTCEGAHLFLGAMAGEYGMPAILEALNGILGGEFPASYEGLEEALTAVAGDSVHDFFDVWVHTGIAPSVKVDWTWDGKLFVDATADVPFGTFSVPLRVESGDEAIDVRIVIQDGVGELDLALATAPDRIRVDPDETLLLRK